MYMGCLCTRADNAVDATDGRRTPFVLSIRIDGTGMT